MTLKEALDFLLNKFFLLDHIYDAREMARDMQPQFDGNSWDHPFVKKFEQAVNRLKDELDRLERNVDG